MNPSLDHIIRLLSVPGIGPRRTLDLFKTFSSTEALFSADRTQLTRVAGISQKLADAILAPIDGEILPRQAHLIAAHEVQIVTIWDAAYPKALREIYDPPIVLFCKGNLDLLQQQAVAIVGTRTPTRYGRENAAIFARELVRQGVCLISGAARGIDTIVHESALQHQGQTIAVLGNGIDRVYPADNRKLYQALSREGLLVSEFLMETKPDAPNFPRRNRIISGLSKGTLVIEAAEKSGSLITAYYALDQNREVFAIPGPISSLHSSGTNKLIREGAMLVSSAEDILAELGQRYQLGISAGQQTLQIALEPEEQLLVDHLRGDALVHIDELAEKTGQTTFAMLSSLLKLEMKGLIQQSPGKYFKLS